MKLIAHTGSKVRVSLPIENKEYISDGPIAVTFDGGSLILTLEAKGNAVPAVLLAAFAPSEWKRVEILK